MHTPNRMWLALFGSVVFSSAGAQTIRHVFQTPPDGTFLVGNPLYVPGSPDDAIFGVTEFGGDKKSGTVWKYDLATNTETVVYSFGKVGNKKGSRPTAGLIQHGKFLYGTTSFGADGYGTLNRIDPVAGQQKVLHVFDDFPGDYVAPDPNDQLLYRQGMLYGTLGSGGDSHFGSIFGCTLGGSCKILYNFAGGTGGSDPVGQLIYATVTLNGVSQPALVGFTDAGGAANLGMVYLLPLSNPTSLVVLHSFTGGSDGAFPTTLLQDGTTIYGATASGGGTGCADDRGSGCGTVFRLSLDSSGYKLIYTFGGLPQGDGSGPNSLLLNGHTLNGTTYGGGVSTNCDQGCGTVFQLATDGSSEQVLASFAGGTKGESPFALTLHDGIFYGLTADDIQARPQVPGTLFSIP